MREEEVARLVKGTADPAFAVDGQGMVTAWNEPAHQLLGVPVERAIGRPCASVIQGTDECGAVCSESCTVRQAVGRCHPPPNFDIVVRTALGPVWCNVSIVMIEVEGSMAPHVIHLMRSVDLSKRFEIVVRDFVVASTGLPADEAMAVIASRHTATSETGLSRREIEILGLLAKGSTTATVASQLHISRTTVNNHVQHILKKLNAHTRLEAIHRAERARLI